MRDDEWLPESLGQIVADREWPTRLVVVAVDSTNDRGTHSEPVPIASMLSRGLVSLLTTSSALPRQGVALRLGCRRLERRGLSRARG